jgi:hypothetical protein
VGFPAKQKQKKNNNKLKTHLIVKVPSKATQEVGSEVSRVIRAGPGDRMNKKHEISFMSGEQILRQW